MDRLEKGASLGPYRIMNQIGEGGMAKVYKAFQANMERYVALKVLPAHYADEAQFSRRFIQEVHTIARLEHKNILPVYDFGEHNGITYLVMRYLEGGTLKEILLQGRLTLHDTLEIMDQVCSALGYAHRQNVIHRDVKPANIMIDAEGAAYLTDFGIAKVVGQSSDLTATGAAIGTPAYMAPEQAVGEAVDSRTDLYALGVVLYEMIVGQVPFRADTPMAVLMAHVHDPLPLPRHIDPKIHELIETVIIKSLAKDPGDRYQSAEAMLQALRQAIYTAAPKAVETTLINLITEIQAIRNQDQTIRETRLAEDISDPHLQEKLEQLYIDGLSAYWIQDWERAQIRLDEVVSISPNYKDAALRLADIKKQNQLSDLRHRAQEAIDQDNWPVAQRHLQEILSTVPNDPEANEKMALVGKQLELASLYTQCEQLFKAGQWQAVINIFERIHQLAADFPDSQNLFSQAQAALQEQHRLDQVKETYQLGLQALNEGNWKQAQKRFQQVNKQEPGYAESQKLLARAAKELSNAKPAVKKSRSWIWVGLIAVVILVVGSGIWYLITSNLNPKPLESYALATATPKKNTSTPSQKEDTPLASPTPVTALEKQEQDGPDPITVGVYDDFSASDGQLDMDRWRLTCSSDAFGGSDNLIQDGHAQFLNSPSPDVTGCDLWLLGEERIPGDDIGGLSAHLFHEPHAGEDSSQVGVSLIANPDEARELLVFCGIYTPPGPENPDRPLMSKLSVLEKHGDDLTDLFYAEFWIEPLNWYDVNLQVQPDLMAFHCQIGDQFNTVWLPENPEQLRTAEYTRFITTERKPHAVALSMVDEVALLPPHHIPPATCPEITDWKAEYWDNADLAGEPVLCRDEGFPLHFWVHGSPAPEIPNDWFSARYTRQMELEAGHYTFRLSGDDGVRLWLDDELLIDEWQDHGFTDYFSEVDLPAGEYSLRVEYFEHGGEAHLELFALKDDQFLFSAEPGCVPAPEGLIGWWAGDGNTNNQLGGPPGTLVNGVSFAPGKIDEAFHFDTSGLERGLGKAVDIPLIPEYEILQYFTVEAWVFLDPEYPRLDQIEDFVILGEKFNLRKEGDGLPHLFTIIEGRLQHLWGEQPLPRGEWIHLVGIYSYEGLFLYQNARPIGNTPVQGELDRATFFGLSNADEPLSGMLDEVSLYNRPLTLGEIRLLYYLGGTYGKCK